MKIIDIKRVGGRVVFQAVLIALITLSFTVASATDQQRTVRGIVLDEAKNPVAGASVTVVGSSQITMTNVNGIFSMTLPDGESMLEISCIGYKTQSIDVGERTEITVQLSQSSIELDDIVVIGYGTAKRGNLTGSIAKIDTDKLADRPAMNIGSSLQGMLAGVEVRANSGAPGEELSIRVRGAASINAEATPLYVVDGIPQDDLASINPADIQSIEVLKDASSSAIYGSRGSNGVILITTRVGIPSEKVNVKFSASFGIQQLERKVDVLSASEWMDLRTTLNDMRYVNAFGASGATAGDDWNTRLGFTGTTNVNYMNDPRWTEPNYGGLALIDWQDKMFRLAAVQNYQLSVSGGGKASNYRVSLGYLDQEGVVIGTSFKRLSLRTTVETKLYDKFSLGLTLTPVFGWTDGGRVDGKDNQGHAALSMAPVAEPEAGVYTGAEPYPNYAWAGTTVSPYAYMKESSDRTETSRINSTAYLKGEILPGLNAEITGSYNFVNSQRRRFIPSSVLKNWSAGVGYNTLGSRTESRSHKALFQTVLNYNRRIDGHNIGAMAGFSMESSKGTTTSITAKQFPDNTLEIFDESDQVIQSASAGITTPERMMSFFGRIQYEYDNRYMLNASLRRDGSSKFGKNNRWGVFPAVSAGYRISNERFWPEGFPVNQLKLRVSWGMNGNNRIPSNAALGLVSSANYSFGGSLSNGFAQSSVENPNLGWEKTSSWNIGLDVGLFQSRIQLTADYYDKTTKDLLYQVSVPAVMGFSSTWDNVGSLKNRGFEIEITSQNLTGQLKWTTSANLSYNKNKVKSLGKDNSTIFTGYDDTTQVLMVGQPLRSYYMYDAVGVYQFSEDLRKYPVMADTQLGEIRYRDANGDGVIDNDDRTLVGKPDPDYTFGVTNTLRYKNFDLSIVVTGQTGGQIFSVLGRAIDSPAMTLTGNALAKWKNMWRSEAEPGDGKTPGLGVISTAHYDTRWIYSSDFVKVKNVTLSYKVNTKKSKIYKYIREAKVYLSVENLCMWNKYDGGFSPEANNGGTAGNYDYGSYPLPRVFSIGINLTLQ